MQTFLLTMLVAIPAIFGYFVAAAILYDEYGDRVRRFFINGRNKPKDNNRAVHVGTYMFNPQTGKREHKKSSIPWL